jgi:SAM-dependent methyltransferase
MSPGGCPLCNAGTGVWFQLERGVVRRCRNASCGVGYLETQPDDDELSMLYREFYYPEHHGTAVFENSTRFKAEQHLDALDNRLGLSRESVLDYGCGEGVFLELARERGITVAGVEFDDVGRATAQSKGFRVERVIDQFQPGSFSLVYMNDVIEHLRDPVADLRSIRARLAPGGALFVVTMNMRGLTPRLRGGKWGVVTNPTHLWFYDKSSLSETLRRAGFDRIEVQRWPVRFDHHGAFRGLAQRALQAVGLDASLRVLAWPADA